LRERVAQAGRLCHMFRADNHQPGANSRALVLPAYSGSNLGKAYWALTRLRGE